MGAAGLGSGRNDEGTLVNVVVVVAAEQLVIESAIRLDGRSCSIVCRFELLAGGNGGGSDDEFEVGLKKPLSCESSRKPRLVMP